MPNTHLQPCACGHLQPDKVISANAVYHHFVCPNCGLVSARRYASDGTAEKEWNRAVAFDRSKRLEIDVYPSEPYPHCSVRRYFYAVELAARLVSKGADYAHVHYATDDFMVITVTKGSRIFRIQSYKIYTVEEHGASDDNRPSFQHEGAVMEYLSKQGVCASPY